MTDAELIAYHEKAVADTNDLIGTVGETWQLANDVLNDPVRGADVAELRNVLARLRTLASEATRRVMTPPNVKRK